jgi:DNA-binding MarR family transcriptional regulator
MLEIVGDVVRLAFDRVGKATDPAPPSEMSVLAIIMKMGEAHAPAIARASNGKVTVSAIYSLLNRLERRGLVEKREVYIEVGDISARRVVYRATAKRE